LKEVLISNTYSSIIHRMLFEALWQ